MSQNEEKNRTAKSVDDDLEPYRRLIELQKQMIELVQQHEKTKRECAALREQLLDEMTALLRPRQNLRRWTSRSLSSLFNRAVTPWKSLCGGTVLTFAPCPIKTTNVNQSHHVQSRENRES